jgi:hypothetical protein
MHILSQCLVQKSQVRSVLAGKEHITFYRNSVSHGVADVRLATMRQHDLADGVTQAHQ